MINFIKEVFFWLFSFRLKRLNVNDEKYSHIFSYLKRGVEFDELIYGSPVVISGREEFCKKYKPFRSYREELCITPNTEGFSFKSNHLTSGFFFYYESSIKYIPALKSVKLNRGDVLKGSCVYLSNTEAQHFGHFIMFTLPLLSVYKNLGIEPDFYYLGDISLKPFHHELLSIFNIPLSKVVTGPCKPERLYYAQVENWCSFNPKNYLDYESYSFIKDTFNSGFNLKLLDNYPKKIFILRGDVVWRRLMNEEKIIGVLVERGYTPLSMDSLSLSQQALYFFNATHIVAVHGAALTNIINCRAKTNILEIFPFDYPDTTSYVLASYSDCKYIAYESLRYDVSTKACYRDISLDINEFISILNKYKY